jgi:hypothetical protein
MVEALDDILKQPHVSVPAWVNATCLKEAIEEDPNRWAEFFEIER